MKHLLITCMSILLISCSKNCKELNGKFSMLTTSIRYTYYDVYEFKGNTVTMMSVSKIGSGDYKPGVTQRGNFKVDGDRVVANFGGSDVMLSINRSSDGCINSISNEIGTFKRD